LQRNNDNGDRADVEHESIMLEQLSTEIIMVHIILDFGNIFSGEAFRVQ